LNRRAGLASLAITAVLLLAMLWVRPDLPAAAYAALLVVLYELATSPVAFYRHALQRRYELSIQTTPAWLWDQARGLAIILLAAAGIAHVLYRLILANPDLWWLMAALLATGVTALVAGVAPVLLLPLFYRVKLLDRPSLSARLAELSRRAGMPVLGVYEMAFGDRTKSANAALVGAGPTRRIVVSDTLLAEYSEDEIEVVLAHELAHHAHGDVAWGLVVEFLLLLAAGYTASVVLNALWYILDLRGPADPAGLPLLALAGGALRLACTPLVHAFTRARERRADAFALALTSRPEAFISAMRRLGAQNLAEENPSRLNVWLFHTHPPIEERIATAFAAAGGCQRASELSVS
jgi:STE24 endopeptidase